MVEVDKLTGSALAAHIDSLQHESWQARHQYESTWRTNSKFYDGKQWVSYPPTGSNLNYWTLNFLQNAIINQAAVEIQDEPKIRFTPREHGGATQYFLRPKIGRQVKRAVSKSVAGKDVNPVYLYVAGLLDVEQLDGIAPIGVDVVEDIIDEGKATESIDESHFDVVNDVITSKALNSMVKWLWDRSNTNYYITQNVILNCIYGCQPLFAGEWNTRKLRFEFENSDIMGVFWDPNPSDADKWAYIILESRRDVNEMQALYPEHGDLIKKSASSGNEVSPHGYRMWSHEVNFERDMVRVRECYLANHEYEQSLDDAIQRGMVFEDDGEYRLVRDGELVTEENVPSYYNCRRVMLIGDEVAVDEECDFSEIPVCHNINIPLANQGTYGQGEPERCRDLCTLINSVFTSVGNICRYHQSPSMWMPTDVYDNLSEKGVSPTAGPNKVFHVDSEIYKQYNGQPYSIVPAPTPSPEMFNLLNTLPSLLDKLTGFNEVQQGGVEFANQSGVAIEMLTRNARGSIVIKSKNLERMLQKLARLMYQALLDHVPEAVWSRVIENINPMVIRAIVDQVKSINWDVEVEVVSGKGQTKRFQQQLFSTLNQAGKISDKDLLEMLDIPDPDGKLRAVAEEAIKKAKLQQQFDATINSPQVPQGSINEALEELNTQPPTPEI